MANFFDQFDPSPTPSATPDTKRGENFFDQFDVAPSVPTLPPQVVGPPPPPDVQSREAMRPLVDPDLAQAVRDTIAQQFQPPDPIEQALGPVVGPLLPRVEAAIQAAAAYEHGAPAEQVAETLSPEYRMGHQMATAESPREFYQAAVPLGLEGLQFATMGLPFLHGEPVGVPPTVPDWATRGPQLVNVPQPYAPPATPDNLVAAIARAQQTKPQGALAAEIARQAALPGPQPIQQPAVGPQPQVNPLDAAAWQQSLLNDPALQQFNLLQRMGQPIPGPLADHVASINQQLAQGFPAPPETRFVTQSREIPGAQAPQPVQPGTTQPSPMPPAGPVPAPSPITAQMPTAPKPVVPPPVPQPGTTGGSHAQLVSQYGPEVIQRGEVGTPQEIIDSARVRAPKVDPYKTASKVTSGQGINKSELADLVVEHERLRGIASERERLMNANKNPQTITDYNIARKQSEDFAVNVLKPAGTAWGEEGRALQSVNPPDPMTLTGARQIAIDRLGRELNEKESNGIERSNAKNNRDMAKSQARAEKAAKSVGPGKIPSRAELQARFEKIMTDLTPCEL